MARLRMRSFGIPMLCGGALVCVLAAGLSRSIRAQTLECFIRVCSTQPDGTKLCVERPIECPEQTPAPVNP